MDGNKIWLWEEGTFINLRFIVAKIIVSLDLKLSEMTLNMEVIQLASSDISICMMICMMFLIFCCISIIVLQTKSKVNVMRGNIYKYETSRSSCMIKDWKTWKNLILFLTSWSFKLLWFFRHWLWHRVRKNIRINFDIVRSPEEIFFQLMLMKVISNLHYKTSSSDWYFFWYDIIIALNENEKRSITCRWKFMAIAFDLSLNWNELFLVYEKNASYYIISEAVRHTTSLTTSTKWSKLFPRMQSRCSSVEIK